MITWRDNDWVAVGARVRLTDAPNGDPISWHPTDHSAPIEDAPCLRGGARGTVVEAPRFGAPAYPCPDHDEGPDDCLCGGMEDGMVPAKLPMATVEWELDDGGTLRQLLRYPGTGGRAWELVQDDEIAEVNR